LNAFTVSVAVIDAVEAFAAAAGASGSTFTLPWGNALVTHARITRFGTKRIATTCTSPSRSTLASVWSNTASMSIVTSAINALEAHGHVARLALPPVVALADARRHTLAMVLGTVFASRHITTFTAPSLRAVANGCHQARLRVGLAGHAFAVAAVSVASVFGAILSTPSILTRTDSWSKAVAVTVTVVGADGLEAVRLCPS
jgi:spore maturation protein SpmB